MVLAMRRLTLALSLACLGSIAPGPLQAQSIDAGLPSSWQAPLAELVRQLGVNNPGEVVRSARTLRLNPAAGENTMLVRFSAPDLCVEDRCLTIDATLENGAVSTHLALYTGARVSPAPGCIGPGICNGIRFATDDGRHSIVIFSGPLGPVLF